MNIKTALLCLFLLSCSNAKAACNCNSCTHSALNEDAGGHTCGDRISWLQSSRGLSEQQACSKVAGEEFPAECSACNPESCDAAPTPTPNLRSNPPAPSLSKCGGAVNNSPSAASSCEQNLWNPTGDSSFACFAYGGPGDSCHLNNQNDPNDGLDKDPSMCEGDTFYLWDEPDTQGRSYSWAGSSWASYAATHSSQLQSIRSTTRVTSPLIRAGDSGTIRAAVDEFFHACGPSCRDPASPAYIDVIAVNAFCGPWNSAPLYCRGGANFIVEEVRGVFQSYNLPVYITNWSRLYTSSPEDQVDAMNAIDAFFVSNSPVERVYWFGATDYGGGSTNNFLTTTLDNGRTLGEVWKEKCEALG